MTAGGAIGGIIYVVIPMIVSELTPQKQRAAMLAIVNSVMTFAGVIAPLAMGAVVQNAATQAAGYERGYLISGGLLLVGGLIGLLCIRPERDRLELARHALPFPSLQPLRGCGRKSDGPRPCAPASAPVSWRQARSNGQRE